MPLQDQVSLRSSFSGEENVQREELSSSNEEDTYSLLAAEQFQNAARRLYISHSLSTWNSRMFEFGAFLFLAGLFPGTLLFASIYALSRSLAVSLLSSWIGGVMDKSNRLSTIRSSIIWQRIPVASSCIIFLGLSSFPYLRNGSHLFFALLVLLACLGKVAATANTVAVERDWAVVLCRGDDGRRRGLNAGMRRIDLIAKLVAPLFISFLDAVSARLALWTVIGSNLASVLIEYSAIAQVYHAVPELADTPEVNGSLHRDIETFEVEDSPTTAHSPTVSLILIWLEHFSSPWLNYFQSPVLLASLSLSILYLTVLSFNAHMVTYLLAIGFSALWIAIFRLISVIVELSATWAAPVLMSRIGPVRSGLWFVTWLFSFAALGVTMLHITAFSQRFSVIALIVGVVLSRIGLWGFDLSVQYLIQEEVPPSHRSQFSATEAALQNFFEMLSFVTTAVFARPEQFKYPVLISVGAIGVANICFTAYVKKNRGHLFHKSMCLKRQHYHRLDQTNDAS